MRLECFISRPQTQAACTLRHLSGTKDIVSAGDTCVIIGACLMSRVGLETVKVRKRDRYTTHLKPEFILEQDFYS